MKIVLATNNPHKVGELTDLLSGEGREIRTLRESGFTGDIVEDGATFEENSYIKARTVSERGKTFAEMTAEEKNAVSHRGIAVRRFAEMFFLDKPASEC